MKKQAFQILGIFILSVFGAIFADQILWPYFVQRPLFYEYGLEENPVYITEVNEITVEENTALKDSIEKVKKWVAKDAIVWG